MRAIVAILVVSFFFYFIFIYSPGDNLRLLNKEIKPIQYSGIIDKKYIDTADRMTQKLVMNNLSEVDVFFVYELWKYVESGDSLFKAAGSYQYTIYRKGSPPISFYPKIDGKEIR